MRPVVFPTVIFPVIVALALATWNRNEIYRSGVDLWSDNLTKRPEHAGSYLGLAEALMKAGNLADAEVTLHDARRRFPDHARLLNLSGLVALEDGRAQAAENYWTRAQQLAPGNHVVLNHLAILAAQKGEWTEAKRLFLQVAELRPTDLIALGNAAQVCVQLGELDEADKFVQRGLDIYPYDQPLQRLRKKIDELMLKQP
jgi:Flp pilus assembly protein TadD